MKINVHTEVYLEIKVKSNAVGKVLMKCASFPWAPLERKSSRFCSFLTIVMCEMCHYHHAERLQDHANEASQELLFTLDAHKLGR